MTRLPISNRWLPVLWCWWAAATAIWSYGFVDGNLTLINQRWFWQWQTWSWQWASQRWLAAGIWFFLVISGWGLAWWWAHQSAAVPKLQIRRRWLGILLVVSVLFLCGQNALSHDIFNYLFNAKMLTVYQADPHYQIAMNYPADSWLRFMHNVHTPAPYGHGWTYLSAIPFYLSGLGRYFLISLLAMRWWMWLGWVLYLWWVWQLLRVKWSANTAWARWWALAVHPVVLVEALLNGHNDVWFMVPALIAMWLTTARPPRLNRVPRWLLLAAAAALLALSMWIKIVTVVLWPVWLALVVSLFSARFPVRYCQLIDAVAAHWADWATLLLLVPLITARSQQFYPWYLVWALAFWPLTSWRWLRWLVAGLSFTALFRYLPWIVGDLQYAGNTLLWMKVISLSGAGYVVVRQLLRWRRSL